MTDRLPDETAEEREARLRKMTASNHARLAAEAAEEREATLESDRVLVRHRQQQVMQGQLPLFQQSSIRTVYISCTPHGYTGRAEMYMRFPGLKIRSHISTECLQCSQDEHTPKLYSSTNDMDPDPVPPLQASTCIIF